MLEPNSNIHLVVFSTAEDSLPPDLAKDTLKNEFLNVISFLNLKEENYTIYNYKVRNLHNERQKILDNLIMIRNKLNPELIIGPSINDFHQDHQIVANEMIRAFKMTASIISYELPWNNIIFNTQCLIRLNKEHIKKKCDLLDCYKSQIQKNRPYFSNEFVYGLAKTRGIQCNHDYAEAFEVLRWIL